MADSRVPVLAMQAQTIADRLERTISTLGETLLDQGYGSVSSDLAVTSQMAHNLADFARGFAARVEDELRATDTDADTDADARWRELVLAPGSKIGRRDRNGKKLRVGDHVQVYDSSRYGNPRGVIVGPGPEHEDGKQRVTVKLDSGADDTYTPSTGRVERITRADAEAADGLEGNGHSRKPTFAVAIEISPDGVTVIGPDAVMERFNALMAR